MFIITVLYTTSALEYTRMAPVQTLTICFPPGITPKMTIMAYVLK